MEEIQPSPVRRNVEVNEEEAEEWHSKGYRARKSGNYEDAVTFYSEAIKHKPDHFKAFFN